MRRREFVAALGGAAAALPALSPSAACAQPAAPANRRPRIGWLVFGGANLGVIDQTLIDALAQRGLVAGRNIDVAFRYAGGEAARLSALAGELVALQPDLLIGISGTIVKALFDANKSVIPIVGGMSENPVRAQFITSLARPDKNFTGITFITDEMAAKRIELLKETAPATKHVAVIWKPQHLDDEMGFAKRAADSLGIRLTSSPCDHRRGGWCCAQRRDRERSRQPVLYPVGVDRAIRGTHRTVWPRTAPTGDCRVA